MARLSRLSLPGQVHHVLQQGNNRQPIFLDAEDRDTFLHTLAECARQHQVAVHAYVLLESRYHLLVTPASAQGVSMMVQALGRSYVRYFNRRHGRSGTLWEGRYRSCLVQHDLYLLSSMRYIELNPVRAGMVDHPGAYRWSSYRVQRTG